MGSEEKRKKDSSDIKMKKSQPLFTRRDISNLQITLMFLAASSSLVFNILHADDDIDKKNE